jgi:hypothetical protein
LTEFRKRASEIEKAPGISGLIETLPSETSKDGKPNEFAQKQSFLEDNPELELVLKLKRSRL